MGTTSDKYKTRSFIYYLQADSVADEWYEDLLQAEKENWEAIEASFFKRWPWKQVISNKEKAILENDASHATTTPQSTSPASEPIPPSFPDPHHEIYTQNDSQDTPEGDVEHIESQDATTTSHLSKTEQTTTNANAGAQDMSSNPAKVVQTQNDHQELFLASRTGPDDGKTPGIAKPPNTSPSSPHIPPNEPISPQPPPYTSITPLNTSTTLETPTETPGFTQKQPKLAVFSQNHAKTPKPPVLDENATDFQDINTNGVPFSSATYYDEEITGIEPYFFPIHDTSHLPVAKSPLPALVDYISSAQASSTLENTTADVVSELKTPAVTTYEPHTPTVNVSIPKNATATKKFGQKLPKPPEITSISIIWHPKIIANDMPTSGKDPPHLSESLSPFLLYIQLTKTSTLFWHTLIRFFTFSLFLCFTYIYPLHILTYPCFACVLFCFLF
jgi:hypothetical protein